MALADGRTTAPVVGRSVGASLGAVVGYRVGASVGITGGSSDGAGGGERTTGGPLVTSGPKSPALWPYDYPPLPS
jgi:hypothetical protein